MCCEGLDPPPVTLDPQGSLNHSMPGRAEIVTGTQIYDSWGESPKSRVPNAANSTEGICRVLSGLHLQGSRKCFLYRPHDCRPVGGLCFLRDLLACLRFIIPWALFWMGKVQQEQQPNVESKTLNNVNVSCQLISLFSISKMTIFPSTV